MTAFIWNLITFVCVFVRFCIALRDRWCRELFALIILKISMVNKVHFLLEVVQTTYANVSDIQLTKSKYKQRAMIRSSLACSNLCSQSDYMKEHMPQIVTLC